jgi:type II secretory pathway predicted ATPase ExeA
MTMYLEHFGLREAPFRITPHTEFFFSGSNRGATLEALTYAITAGEGMVKVTGEVGSGKTMLCRVLMERLPANVETVYLAVPSLSRDEMLVAIAGDLGVDAAGATTTKLVRALQDRLVALHAEGKQVVALIDEAHAMPLETLEEIRLLSNLETGREKLLQIVLFGQPELDDHLGLPHMRQLKERITHAFRLEPMPPRDIKDYLGFRLRAAGYHGPDLFGPDALNLIAEASEGLTRRINIFADKTLLAAYAAGTHTISADHVRAAISDTQIVVPRRSARRPLVLAAAIGVLAGLTIGFIAGRSSIPPAPVTPATAPPANADAPPASAAVPSGNAPAPAPARAAAEAKAMPADPVAARFAAGRTLVEGGGAGKFVIQLMTTDAREKAYLESYLADASRALKPGELFLLASGNKDSPRVIVLHGPFGERSDALAALESLPVALRQFRPYVRPVESVRSDWLKAEQS